MENQQNPWFVKDLEEFLYFCCPECDIKNRSKELFLKHALDFHPNAKEHLFYLNVKTENHENSDIIKEDFYNEIVKCEIKEEEINGHEDISEVPSILEGSGS